MTARERCRRDFDTTRLTEKASFLKELIGERKSAHKYAPTGKVAGIVNKLKEKEDKSKKGRVEEKRPPLATFEDEDVSVKEEEKKASKKYFGSITSTKYLNAIFGRDEDKAGRMQQGGKKKAVVAVCAARDPLIVRTQSEYIKEERLEGLSRLKKRLSEALINTDVIGVKAKRLAMGAREERREEERKKEEMDKVKRTLEGMKDSVGKRLAEAEEAQKKEERRVEEKREEQRRERLERRLRRRVPPVPTARGGDGVQRSHTVTVDLNVQAEQERKERVPSTVLRRPLGEPIGRRVQPRPLSRTMTMVEQKMLEPLVEDMEIEVDSSRKKPLRRYGGSHTTSTYNGQRDAAPDASARRHLIGFLHRTSHLSLTSEMSGDASYYLIGHRQAPGGGGRRYHEESTIGSESDARIFSDDDDRGSTTTDITSVSRQHENMHRRRKMRSKNYRKPSRASSFSSITESSMSLDVITVTLNMDTVNFLGISIVGQSSARGDNGIYVANIMKGGAVALDGRIEAGDMILQVNDISFENFTNDQAVDVLRDAVARKGPIKLTVAKCFENGPKSCFTAPRAPARDEPVRPIDTQAWIQHTNAMRGMPSILEGSEGAPTPIPGDYHHHGRPPSSSTVTSGSAGGAGGVPQTVVQLGRLDVNTDKKRVVESMSMPGSGLDIKNRTWLKIPIPMSFLGSDLVDWLLEHVEGLRERKDARKYASDLLKAKLIAHVVNKITFTEQCYYVLGEECADFARYRTPLPDDARWAARGSAVPAGGAAAATGGSMVSGYASMPVSPYPLLGRPNDVRSQVSAGSGDGSGSGSDHRRNRNVILPPAPPQAVSQQQPLHELPSDVAASRQSFRMAMDHPYELNELF